MDAIKTAKVWIGERKGITSPIHVSQYDTAWTFQFKVYKDDLIYEPENTVSVVFTGKKSDDTVFAVPADFEDGVATVASTVAMTSAAGIVECELRFSESEETVGTANFDMVVEPSPVEGGTPSEDDFTTLQTMVDAVAQSAARAETAADAAATEVLNEVPDMIYDWLEANVTPETGYVIDNSLSVQGAAADAKASGNRIGSLERRADNTDVVTSIPLTFEQGDISSSTGGNSSSTTRLRCGYTECGGKQFLISVPQNAKMLCYVYRTASTTTFIGRYGDGWFTSDFILPAGTAGYFRLVFAKNDDSTVVAADANCVSAKVIKNISAIEADIDTVSKGLIDATGKGFLLGDFDIGSINIVNTGWTYNAFPSRVRTKQGKTIPLKVGDVIGCTSYSDARYYIGWEDANNTYHNAGWLTADYTVTQDGDYVILLCHSTDTVLVNKNELLDLFFIHRSRGAKSIYDLPWWNNGKMRLHAHKGIFSTEAASDLLENSVNSFTEAGKNKLFICETDIRQTSDGHLVCMHDAAVDRTTNGSGNVSEMTLAQIRALKLKRANGTASDLLVPTIDEYLTVCKKYNMVAAMELKAITTSGFVAKVVGKIHDYGMDTQCLLICSVANADTWVRSVTDLPVMLIVTDASGNWDASYAYAQSRDYVAITFDKGDSNLETKVKTCHNAGVPCDVFVAPSKSVADTFFEFGMDMVTGDSLTEHNWSDPT